MRIRFLSALMGALVISAPVAALAGDGEAWWSGDWYIKLGGAGFVAPRYEGAKSYMLTGQPLISFGRAGDTVRFSSRTDNASFALYDNDGIRAGIVGKFILPRDKDTSDDLKGLKPVPFGGELGGFVEAYPTDWVRVRAEVRQGIHSHDGIVADLSADAFTDITPTIRISAGPRVSFATNGYMDAYYKVTPQESARSGLSAYDPSGGLKSIGVASAITWQATDKIEASAFAEYRRLTGDVADSSLVRERGSRDQFVIGLSSIYRFDFTLP